MIRKTTMPPDIIDEILTSALREDIGSGDITTDATVDPTARATGVFRAKAEGIISGTSVAARVFGILPGLTVVDWEISDGESVAYGQILGRISGNARTILTGERTALNILQRMSGISTATSQLVNAVRGTRAVILDTRKTAPGLRPLDREAVRAGGGVNHRFGLYDMIMIKDNHIVSAGSIARAISNARHKLEEKPEHRIKIEVEARTLDEVREVVDHFLLTGDPDRILLDNMVSTDMSGLIDTSLLREAVDLIGGRLQTEASGNVTIKTAPAIAATGVDFISSGSLTHSVIALDISLEFVLSK